MTTITIVEMSFLFFLVSVVVSSPSLNGSDNADSLRGVLSSYSFILSFFPSLRMRVRATVLN